MPIYYDYEIVNTYPHDNNAFTQGLFYHDGFLYEGTGNYGTSTLRKVELKTGKVLKSVPLENEYFGEGITLLNNKIYQLTYQSRKVLYTTSTPLNVSKSLRILPKAGGLTTDGMHLIMSDGSSFIRYLDPETFKEVRHIEVHIHKGPITELNELE
jgi:glutaminyl-peptide cyclotransferase